MSSGDSRNVVRSNGEKIENTSHQGNLQDAGNYKSASVKDDLGSCDCPSFLNGLTEIRPQNYKQILYFHLIDNKI